MFFGGKNNIPSEKNTWNYLTKINYNSAGADQKYFALLQKRKLLKSMETCFTNIIEAEIKNLLANVIHWLKWKIAQQAQNNLSRYHTSLHRYNS